MAGTLQGRVAVVVGGHSGFGRAIAERFVREGAGVVIAGRREDVLQAAADELGARAEVCDITDEDQVDALVDGVLERDGRLDIGVNCAGYEQSTPLPDLRAERLVPMVEVQLIAAITCLRAFGDGMKRAGNGGAICSMSSLTAHNPGMGLVAYGSAKAGLEHATRIAAVEYGPHGIRVNCVSAHLIETPMTERIFRNRLAIQAMVESTPLRRMGSAEDIAKATYYLCSDEGSYVSGQTLCVDGGASLLNLPTPEQLQGLAARRPDLLGPTADAAGDGTG